jgi:calnexin
MTWDDRAKIPDPEASKPDDWDEEAPREIEDEDAEKPEVNAQSSS